MPINLVCLSQSPLSPLRFIAPLQNFLLPYNITARTHFYELLLQQRQCSSCPVISMPDHNLHQKKKYQSINIKKTADPLVHTQRGHAAAEREREEVWLHFCISLNKRTTFSGLFQIVFISSLQVLSYDHTPSWQSPDRYFSKAHYLSSSAGPRAQHCTRWDTDLLQEP